MQPDFRWITAVYGAWEPESGNLAHIAVPETALRKLREMAAELVGTDGLIALYVPEGTEDVYAPGAKRGRVISAVQLVPMPPDRTLEDFYGNDWDESRRWPIGWPARLVFSPPVAECPVLREHVESLFGAGSFGGYVARFQHGPFSLDTSMRQKLNSDFSSFAPLC